MVSSGVRRNRLHALLDALGVDIVREDFSWNRIQQSKTSPFIYDGNAGPDQYVEACARMGIEVQAILNYGVPWATTAADSREARRRMPQMESWLEYVRATVSRYKDRIRYWEIWNEPDIRFWLDTPDKYAGLFDRTGAEIARIHPGAMIMNGGLAMVSRQPNPDFAERFIARANPTHWHLRAWHDYNTFDNLLTRHQRHESLYQARPELATLPSWMNEGGYHTIDPRRETEQARTIVKKVSTAPALGLSAYFVYTTRDSSTDRAAPGASPFYGLTDFDCVPKPAFAAYNRLVAETAHLRYAPPPVQPDPVNNSGLWQHLYTAASSPETRSAPDVAHILVIWREGAGHRPVWLHWPDAHVADAVDLMGNPVALTRLGNGGVVLNLGDNPVYVRLNGTPAYPGTKTLLDLPDLLSLVSGGQPASLDIRIENPTTSPLLCHLQITGDNPALGISGPLPPITLAPASSRLLRLPIAIPPGSTDLPDNGQLSVALSIDAISGEITGTLPYKVARVLSPGKSYAFSLGSRSDINNRHEGLANPVMEWQGRHDLGATGQWSVTSKALTLTIDVTDQTHHQPCQRDLLWQADSLQFAFKGDDSQRGHLELLLALCSDNSPQGWVIDAPEWTRFAKGNLDGQASFGIARTGTVTTYKLTLPWRSLGYDKKPAIRGAPVSSSMTTTDLAANNGCNFHQASEIPGIPKNIRSFAIYPKTSDRLRTVKI
ncbi:MAG: hypothetical protein LBK99_20995 [Opitutaceae bacterium]|jgi:hypothetical protein|nr:hypothetical protein [Opitutaceae bacterium]